MVRQRKVVLYQSLFALHTRILETIHPSKFRHIINRDCNDNNNAVKMQDAIRQIASFNKNSMRLHFCKNRITQILRRSWASTDPETG